MKRPTPSATETGDRPVGRSLGEQMVRAIAAKDATRLIAVLDAGDLPGITPKKFWDAETAVEVVDEIMLGRWFDPGSSVVEVDALDTGVVGDVWKVSFGCRWS